MEYLLNNRKEEIKKNSISVSELLKIKKFTFKMLVVKINGELVKKVNYDKTKIKDGDKVIVLHMVSGG